MPKNSENTGSWLQFVTNSKGGYILSYPFTKKRSLKRLSWGTDPPCRGRWWSKIFLCHVTESWLIPNLVCTVCSHDWIQSLYYSFFKIIFLFISKPKTRFAHKKLFSIGIGYFGITAWQPCVQLLLSLLESKFSDSLIINFTFNLRCHNSCTNQFLFQRSKKRSIAFHSQKHFFNAGCNDYFTPKNISTRGVTIVNFFVMTHYNVFESVALFCKRSAFLWGISRGDLSVPAVRKDW